MQVSWPTVALGVAAIAGAVVLTVTHHDVPSWLGVLIGWVVGGPMPQAVSRS